MANTSTSKNRKTAKTLSSVAEIIAFLGGRDKAARWAGHENASLVAAWLSDNAIPPGYHYRLHLEAEAAGFTLDPRAVGHNRDGTPSNTVPGRPHPQKGNTKRRVSASS